MSEEEFKSAVKNMLMMQNNNDQNFQILQAQIDNLQRQLNDLNDLKEMFRLPKPQNKNRKAFEEVDWWSLNFSNQYAIMAHMVISLLLVNTISV